jgi:hypothetical protein
MLTLTDLMELVFEFYSFLTKEEFEGSLNIVTLREWNRTSRVKPVVKKTEAAAGAPPLPDDRSQVQGQSTFSLLCSSYSFDLCLSGRTPLIDALQRMHSRRISAIPLDDAAGAKIGLYAVGDIRYLPLTQLYNALHVPVSLTLLKRHGLIVCPSLHLPLSHFLAYSLALHLFRLPRPLIRRLSSSPAVELTP